MFEAMRGKREYEIFHVRVQRIVNAEREKNYLLMSNSFERSN